MYLRLIRLMWCRNRLPLALTWRACRHWGSGGSFLPVDGERAGRLWPLTWQQGLSQADRACLSLRLRLGLTLVTGDRSRAQLPQDLEGQLLG